LSLYYLETSALVKLYIRETGTERLMRLAARASGHQFAVLTLARVELHSAIRRREREGDIESALANRVLTRFEQHLETRFLKQMVNDALLDTACALIGRQFLRAYDAVQLAGCMALRTVSGGEVPIFVCSDRRLIEAAQAEGLSSLDPSA
jgi:uncharacterized protein